MRLWMRQLQIVLTSSTYNKSITIGTKYDEYDIQVDALDIKVNLNKYLSSIKDNAKIEITNLTYAEMIQIIRGDFFTIDIYAGYRETGLIQLFSGGILYISNELQTDKSNTVIILATNKLIAQYGQSRLSLSLNSGINMAAALSFICRRAGVANSKISTELASRIVRETTEVSTTIGNFLESFAENYDLYVSADSSSTSDVSIFDYLRYDSRIITLTSDIITLSRGYPKLTTDGLSLTCKPSFNFQPGDTIIIDNSIVDMSMSSQSEVLSNYIESWIDLDGKYVIFEISYTLQNRGNTFEAAIKAKSKTMITSLSGDES